MDSVKQICEALVKGESKDAIFKRLQVPDKETLYNEAVLAMASSSSVEEDAERNKGMARLNMLFANALKLQDYKTCLAVQKEINLLLSLKKEPEADSLPDLSGGYE
jgi:hypothetical protein